MFILQVADADAGINGKIRYSFVEREGDGSIIWYVGDTHIITGHILHSDITLSYKSHEIKL